MAERRMFAKKVIESDLFLDMPSSARLLYYDLGMRSDDDGFVGNPKTVVRITGAANDDLKLLCAKGFLIPFDSGVVVIKHWKQNNYIRSDRYNKTRYIREYSQLTTSCDDENAYELHLVPSGIPPDNQATTSGIPDGNQAVDEWETQVRLGKVRLGKDRLGKDTLAQKPAQSGQNAQSGFDLFWAAYPKKRNKGDAEKAWKGIKPSNELVSIMLNKLEQAKTCRDWVKDGGQYIPYPASWLRRKGWEDDLADAHESANYFAQMAKELEELEKLEEDGL